MTNEIDKRAAVLLKLLVERYIEDGQPVSSRTLARSAPLQVSPATIRNIMADLDELGLVASPHTSAGRVPTNKGYRYFIDSLLTPESIGGADRERITAELLGHDRSPEELLAAASEVMSSISSMAALVTVPRRNHAVLRRIEFVPLSGQRVLAVLVVNEHEVQNRVVHVDRDYSADELTQMTNFLNEHYVGTDMFSLRAGLVEDVQRTRERMNRTLRAAARMAEQAMRGGEARDDFVMHGGSNLMAFEELADLERLRGLFDAFDRKREILGVFDQCLHGTGVQIFIGDESGYSVLDECSVVTAPYHIGDDTAGVLAVIGPTRMAYSRIIPLVRATAGALTRGLNSDAS